MKYASIRVVAGQNTRDPDQWRSADEGDRKDQEELEESHQWDFEKTCGAIGKENNPVPKDYETC